MTFLKKIVFKILAGVCVGIVIKKNPLKPLMKGR